MAADLGTDKVVTYEYGDEGLKVYAVSDFEPGDGPRHIAFHEDGKHAYIVHEISNMVSTVAYNDGKFTEIERHQQYLLHSKAKLNLQVFDYRMTKNLFILVIEVMIVLPSLK